MDIIVLNIVIELPFFSDLHDDKDIIGRIKDFIELDDILVIDELEYSDFSFYLSYKETTFDIIFLLFILRLFMIFTATRTPVRSCRASSFFY